MVSRANVPRKMTSATPLTEAEEIELERIKDRIDASICKFKRKLDADLDKIRRSLQDMCSTMETKDVSSGNCKSQLELPKFSDDRDFHKSSNVDRAIADEDLIVSSQGRSMETTDASSDSRESNEKEREPIGELFLSCNITDHHLLEVESSLESKDYLRVEKSRKESVEIGAQNQGIFILPPARENAKMKELVFGEGIQLAVDARAVERLDHGKETELLANARRNAPSRELTAIVSVIRNLKGFSVRFPRPMVKMKLELFSLWELLRETDMLGVSKRKVIAHAWSLEQGLLVIELMTFNFSMFVVFVCMFSLLQKAHRYHHTVSFFSGIIDQCSSLKSSSNSLKLVHAQLVKIGLKFSNVYLGNRCIDLYFDSGSPKDAVKMFDDISSKNIFSWNLYLKVLVKCFDMATARRVFDEMPERDAVSWNTVISGNRAKEMHCRIVKNGGCYSNLLVGNSLIDMYGKLGLVGYSLAVFLSMEKVDVISWNAMISGCCKSGYEHFAWHLFCVMRSSGIFEVDEYTVSAMLAALPTCGIGERFGAYPGLQSLKFVNRWWSVQYIDWLVSNWFPKPTVKMKQERLGSGIREVGSMIPCGQGILRGRDCYDHNCRRKVAGCAYMINIHACNVRARHACMTWS